MSFFIPKEWLGEQMQESPQDVSRRQIQAAQAAREAGFICVPYDPNYPTHGARLALTACAIYGKPRLFLREDCNLGFADGPSKDSGYGNEYEQGWLKARPDEPELVQLAMQDYTSRKQGVFQNSYKDYLSEAWSANDSMTRKWGVKAQAFGWALKAFISEQLKIMERANRRAAVWKIEKNLKEAKK